MVSTRRGLIVKKEKKADEGVVKSNENNDKKNHENTQTEYELIRRKKIELNRMKMLQLGLSSSALEIEKEVLDSKMRKSSSSRSKRKPRPVVTTERRRSKRHKGGDESEMMYLIGVVGHGKGVVVGSQPTSMGGTGANTKQLINGGSSTVQERERETRFDGTSISLEEATGGSDIYGSEYLNKIKALWDIDGIGSSSSSSGEGVDTEYPSLSGYVEGLSKLHLKDHHVCKVVPERIYSVAIHPTSAHPLCAAGDKKGNIGLWKVPGDDEVEPAGSNVLSFRPHIGCVNALEFTDNNGLLSFSYDGTVRRFDIEKCVFDLQYASKDNGDDGWLQHGTLVPSNNNQIVIAMSTGNVLLVDTRTGKAAWNKELHDKKVQTVSMNPVDSQYLCTASLDRTMKIWDIRHIKPNNPLCMNQDLRSINCATFSPDGKRVVSVGQGNEMRLFLDPHLCNGDLQAHHKIKHNNQTGRYLTVFHHAWDPKRPDSFVVGSMAQPRQVEVYSAISAELKTKEKFVLRRVMSLQEPDLLRSVHSRHAIHPKFNMIVSGNSSGKIAFFK